MKKAFTLIELISTIVILGIVASVVSILVMNIIRSSKENANRRNIDEYGRIIETSMAEYQSQYLKYPDSIDQLEIEYVGSVWKNVMPYDTERHVFYLDAYGNIKIDDNNYSTGSQLSSNINLSIYLFSLHGLNGRNVYSKLYSSKIYDGDTLIRDYIPVIDPSERPCLFDKVGKECYYNQGTGEFLYG